MSLLRVSYRMAMRKSSRHTVGVQRNVYDAKPVYRNQMNQTRIGYEASLTHPQTVKMLVNQDSLHLTDFKPFSYYEITKKGRRCLQLFLEIVPQALVIDTLKCYVV